MIVRAIVALMVVVFAAIGQPAAAHLTPNSEVGLAIGSNTVDADIIVPQGEYAYATGNPVGNDVISLAQAKAYLARHFEVTAPDGRAWKIELADLGFVQIAGPPDLHATARLIPPPGASPRKFRIRWSALLGELPSHFALFVLTGDSDRMVGQGGEVLGAVRVGSTEIEVDRGASSTRAAFANAVQLGIAHISGGYDHLLFLLALLLPAPLIAHAGRWSERRSVRDTVMKLLGIVTAFTVGHSLTLIGATVGGGHLPAPPVEIAIAVSVLVSAIHAIRPLVPGREPLVALGFGLIHGMAFATLLHDAGAGATSTAATLLGFNVGIELVQVGIVAMVMPALFALSRTRIFSELRVTLAALTAGAASLWIVDRATGAGEIGVAWIDAIMQHGLWGIAALYVLAFALMANPARHGARA
jgi:hypothetical protein